MSEIRNLVDRWWSRFLSGELDRIGEIVDEDVAFEGPGVSLRGAAALRPFLAVWREAFPDMRVDVREVVEDGSTAMVALHIHATHTGPMRMPEGEIPATGKPVVWIAADYVTARDGRITSWHAYWDRTAFLRQLGLMPG